MPDTRNPPTRLGWQIVAACGCRLTLNTARRFAYPFAPALSRGLQVPLTAVTSMVAAVQVAAFLGLFVGPLADRWGYRRMMLVGLGVMAAGMLSAGSVSIYPVVLVGLFCAGIGKSIYDPAIYGYAGARVPFAQRGRVTGLLEFAWAGSALVGIPLLGMLIEKRDWRAPFWCLGALGVLFMALTAWLVPRDTGVHRDASPTGMGALWRRVLQDRGALGLLGFAFCTSLGNDHLFVVFGIWMEKSFSLGIGTLGLATAVIGAAEFAGEGLTVAIGDRLGLKRSAVIGSVLAAGGYFLLPYAGGSLTMALAGLFLVFLAFEFSMVSAISLSTEVLPEFRATMMAAFYTAAGLGRLLGALAGGVAWTAGGLPVVGMIAALVTLASLVCLLAGRRSSRASRDA